MEGFYYSNLLKTHEFILPISNEVVSLTIDSDTSAEVIYAKFLTLTINSDFGDNTEIAFSNGIEIVGSGKIDKNKCNDELYVVRIHNGGVLTNSYEYVLLDKNNSPIETLVVGSKITFDSNKTILVSKV